MTDPITSPLTIPHVVYLQPGEQPVKNENGPTVYLIEKPSPNESELSKVIDRRMSEFTASLGMYMGGFTILATVITNDPAAFAVGTVLTVSVVATSSLATKGMQVMGDAIVDGGSYLIRLPFRALHGAGCGVIETVKLVYNKAE